MLSKETEAATYKLRRDKGKQGKNEPTALTRPPHGCPEQETIKASILAKIARDSGRLECLQL